MTKATIPPGVQALILKMRQEESFPELLKLLRPVAPIPRYAPKKEGDAEDVEKQRANWIFRSGQWSHSDLVCRALTGTESPKGDE
jgi:hypothetical protein